MNRHVIITALAAFAILVISPVLARADTAKWSQFLPIEPPLPFPQHPFFDEQGNEHSIKDYHGTPLVINLWATWCAPCVREMPALNALHENLKEDGIEVLALSQDRGNISKITDFLADKKLDNLLPRHDRRGRIMRQLGINALPTTIFVDANGNEIGRVRGVAEWDSVEVAAFIRVLFSNHSESDG